MIHLVSDTVYEWFVTCLISATAIGWTTVEVVRLRRTLQMDRADPVVRDRLFGHVIGLCIALLAAAGVVRHFV